MKCSAYVDYGSVDFLISIFTDDKSVVERYLIEIQRRSGEIHAVHSAVRGIRSSLLERNVTEKVVQVKRGWGEKAKAAIEARTKSSGPDALARLQAMPQQEEDGCCFRSVHRAMPMPMPASAYASFPIVETENVVVASVNHAVRLASSPYDDVKAEAVQSLAGMASQEQSQRALIASDDGVKVAVACLRSLTPDVHRCAASVLANLLSASAADVCERVRVLVESHNGGDELFRLILREKSEQQPESAPVSPQVLRECSRALVALYDKMEMPKSTNAVVAIQKLRAHNCPVVRKYAERLVVM